MMGKRVFNKELLVEGKNDQHVIWALCNKHSIPENFEVLAVNGVERLIEGIGVRLKNEHLDTLGIVVDADNKFDHRWQALRNVFERKGYLLPEVLPKEGLIYRIRDELQIGIWIMPENQLEGMLEDFLLLMIPKEDKLLGELEKFLDHIETISLNKYNPNHRTKALIRAWLALQDEPDTTLGQAITKQYLSVDNPISKDFVNWLKNLFH